MRCLLCKTLGHNKKGCPLARNQGGRAGTSLVGGEITENVSSTTACGRAGTSESASAVATSTMESGTFTQPITNLSTQQSTNVAGGPKRKTNEPRRGGANARSKRPKAA
uniref:Uncharacterized protein n=1 Tax=Nicotiana tabacum TaxID=4097 RepID=A0A1S4BER9_TOBAC|nr:PREDICTED: uncharacterized protein LOC107807531 [Nicotiana tabacum]